MDLKIENLSVKFKDFVAVDGLNLHVKSGELVSLLGPSGCGKSTTIFTIAGIHKAANGSISFNDKIIDNVDPEKRNIGMVFQNYSLYPHMNVFDNIAFPLKLQKKDKQYIKENVLYMANLVKIEELLKRKPSELSGGQQQRVAIARALVKKPEILLLDEPLSNLDAKLRVEMRSEIRRIQKELNITTIFVTHDQEEALSISDKIVILKDGKLQQYDLPNELYKNPKNLFVANFIGNPSINIFDCYISKEKNVLNIFDKNLKLDDFKNIDKISEKVNSYKVGIRPEDFVVNTDNKYFDGKIMDRENIGKDSILKVDINGANVKIVVPYDLLSLETKDISIGIKKDRLLFFDAETGENIKFA